MRYLATVLLHAVLLAPLGGFSFKQAPLPFVEDWVLGPEDHPVTPENVATKNLQIKSAEDFERYVNEALTPFEDAEFDDGFNVTLDDLGVVQGRALRTFLGRPMAGFLGIPYAKPPIGKRRFKYPEMWTEALTQDGSPYDATYLRPRCPQISMILNITSGREDCLHLSVYTPKLGSEDDLEDLPVMVFIHGGAFMTGDASLYVPSKLLDRDVVVVVVQYRLGTLGFLAAGIDDCPGNMGLMDQLTALEWIQTHIHHFGGDNTSVTIFGQSAGGASVSWLQMTPLTNASYSNTGTQLMHRVIAMSGSSLEHWARDKDVENSLIIHAKEVNCYRTSKAQIIKCMRKKPMEDIVNGFLSVYMKDRANGGLGFLGMAPVVQPESLTVRKFTTKPVEEIVAASEFLRVPFMGGSVRDEGSLVTGLAYKDFLLPNGLLGDEVFLRDNCIDKLIQAFGLNDSTRGVAKAMELTFFRGIEMGNFEAMTPGIVDMTGMLFLKAGLWQLVHSLKVADPDLPIFFYSFEFESDDSLFPWMFISTPNISLIDGGVGHADDLLYLFHLPSHQDDRERAMVQRSVEMWANFAEYGHPTPPERKETWGSQMEEWVPFDIDNLAFMLIRDNLVMDKDFTTRWNHGLVSAATTVAPPVTTEEPDVVNKTKYNAVAEEREQFKLATAILGALCGCLVFLAAFFFVKGRESNKRHTPPKSAMAD